MLQREQPAEQRPVAQIRISTEELAKAVAAIEARHQEEAERLEGTVLIDDAIKTLQLDMTPEEVLAEVEAQRRAQKDGKETTEQSRISPGLLGKLLLPLVGMTGVIVMGFWTKAAHPLPGPPVTAPPVTAPPVTAPPVTAPPVTRPLSPPPIVNAISLIPDNSPFYCLPSEVEEVIRAQPLSQISVITAPALSRYAPWTLIKHKGKVYIRGWISKSDKPSLAASRTTPVYNFDPASAPQPHLIPVTLRVGGFEFLGFYTRLSTPLAPKSDPHTEQMLAAVYVQMDRYAWEKW